MTALSVAIIGTGNIAGDYDRERRNGERGIYSHAGAYAASGKFLLRSVFDTDHQRAKLFRDYWKADTAVSKIEDIYQGFHDVVSVCTQDDTHFEIVRGLLENRCCRVIFVEKPVALYSTEIRELEQLTDSTNIDVVVNFQRRNEPKHQFIREQIAVDPDRVLSVGGLYIKGLRHIGITMIDTLRFLLGEPEAVLAYHRTFNREVNDYSYEFILFYDGFNATVRTTDVERHKYNYHIFEVDILFSDRRITLLDNSRVVREVGLGGYAYSGVNVLAERSPDYMDTEMPTAMVDAVEYIHKVVAGALPHTLNTLADSYNNARIVERVVESFEQGSIKLELENEI